MSRRPMAESPLLRHSARVMNNPAVLPFALIDLSPASQLMSLFFIGWLFIMFVVVRIDGTRAR